MNHPRRTILAFLGVLPWATAAADVVAGTRRYYEVHGAKLYVEKFGHGPPTIFLHGGLMFFDNSFKNQREYFAAYRTVIGIDQRSHGHSPDGDWTLSYQLMADDTAAIIEQLHLGPVDVVGISDGGNIALLLARDHPDRVRRIVISGANLRSGLTPQQAREQRTLPADALAAKLKKIEETVPQNFRPDYARVSPDGPDHWNTLLRKDYFMWIEPVVIEPDDLKKIQAPVLVMAGDHDLISLEDTIEIYRALPHAQLMIVPDCNHGTFLNRPALVNLAVREFLDPPRSARH